MEILYLKKGLTHKEKEECYTNKHLKELPVEN